MSLSDRIRAAQSSGDTPVPSRPSPPVTSDPHAAEGMSGTWGGLSLELAAQQPRREPAHAPTPPAEAPAPPHAVPNRRLSTAAASAAASAGTGAGPAAPPDPAKDA